MFKKKKELTGQQSPAKPTGNLEYDVLKLPETKEYLDQAKVVPIQDTHVKERTLKQLDADCEFRMDKTNMGKLVLILNEHLKAYKQEISENETKAQNSIMQEFIEDPYIDFKNDVLGKEIKKEPTEDFKKYKERIIKELGEVKIAYDKLNKSINPAFHQAVDIKGLKINTLDNMINERKKKERKLIDEKYLSFHVHDKSVHSVNETDREKFHIVGRVYTKGIPLIKKAQETEQNKAYIQSIDIAKKEYTIIFQNKQIKTNKICEYVEPSKETELATL